MKAKAHWLGLPSSTAGTRRALRLYIVNGLEMPKTTNSYPPMLYQEEFDDVRLRMVSGGGE